MGQYLPIIPPEIHQHQGSLLLRTFSFLFVESELKFFGAFFFSLMHFVYQKKMYVSGRALVLINQKRKNVADEC